MNEKSVSKQQQKFFGIVRGLQTGKIKDASPEAKKVAATMSKKDVKDFAATKHKGLPKMKESLPSKDEACWDTHKQVGMKKKGGKMVPNCVPEKVEEKVNEAIPLAAPLIGLAARGAAKAAGRYLAKKATKAVAKKVAKRVAVGAAGAVGRAAVGAAIPAAAAAYTAKKAKDKLGNKEKKESVSSADKKPEIYIKPDGKRGVRMVKVDREIITKEGYLGAKGEKGRDYHNAGTFDKETAYSHAKKHNGVVHKHSSGKYLVKHGRGKNVSERVVPGGGGLRVPFKAALKTSDYPKGTSMSAQKFKDSQKKMSKQRALSTKDYPKGTSMSATAWKNRQEEVELDEAIDFRKAFMDIQSYAKKNGGMDKTDFEKVAYYVKAIGDNQNTPNVANKAFMLMKKHIAGLDTDVRDGIHMLLKKHGMIKNGRIVQESIELDEGWRSGGGGHRSPFKAYSTGGGAQSMSSRRGDKYKELSHEYEDEKKLARLKQLQRQKAKAKKEENESVDLKSFTTIISELTDKQRAEIAKRKAANQAKRGARRGPSKGTKSSEGDWTADQQKSAKPLSFEINKNDKHDAVHKTLAKAADASHPSLGGRKVTVKINGKSKEMAHKDLQHAVDLHKRLPLPKKKAVMDLIRDKGHEGVAAAANHFRKTYK